MRDKLAAAAAALLEAAPADVEIADGMVGVRGAPAARVPLAKVIQAAVPTFAKAGVASPDFEATVYHHQPTVTYTAAVHVAHVEVDAGTGAVEAAPLPRRPRLRAPHQPHDRGWADPRRRRPGRGRRALEEMVYDDEGQLLTGTLMDYLVPDGHRAAAIETVHLEYPSPRNPLGIKGIGEGGAISPPAAIANAVEDALAPFGVRVRGRRSARRPSWA